MAGGFSDNDEVISGINVTPLVDVVLVLLVIFMITAPVIYQSSIKVKLPSSSTGQDNPDAKALSFTIDSQENVFWNNEKLTWDELNSRLAQLSPADKEKPVSINADEKSYHGQVIRLMDALQKGGLHRFALNVAKKARAR